MTTPERIKKISEKLQQLKTKDGKLEVFGAGDNPWYDMRGHHYDLNPVATEKEVVLAEKLLDIRFPEEYRQFIQLAGNGGAGPAWGLYELSNTHPDEEFLKDYPDFCSMEFPYDNEYAEAIMADIKKDITLRGPFDEAFGGFIKLSNYGHEMSAILITSGEQYGKIWLLDEGQSITPFFQDIKGREHGVGFLDWYENWLDEYLIPGAAQSQF